MQYTVHQAPLLEYIATDVDEDHAQMFETQISQLKFKACSPFQNCFIGPIMSGGPLSSPSADPLGSLWGGW